MPDRATTAETLAAAIQTGDLDTLRRVLAEHPEVASTALGGGFESRTALHIATDWPGYFPCGPETVRILIEAGADPDARGPSHETPLHWAASSDDVEVARALVDAGANIEAPEGSIGTPLGNAIGYGCWHVAELLVARGVRVDEPWHASALGLVGRLAELLGDDPKPDVVSQAFWHACAGAQRRAAEYLLSRGADLSWVPDYANGTPLDAARGRGTRRENLISWLEGELGAR